jgi:hypothetical protein
MRRPARTVLSAVTLAAVATVGVGAYQDLTSWKAEMADAAGVAAGPAELRSGPQAAGNALCLDVCRSLTAEYDVARSAPRTVAEVADRLRAAGFAGVRSGCGPEVWCDVSGERDGLAVRASQYDEDAPYDLTHRRILTVTVTEAD